MDPLQEIVSRLADREAPRSEAALQADLASFLRRAPFDLDSGQVRPDLEAPAGRGRIDVEAGTTVFEVKRHLGRGGVLERAVEQVERYVRRREAETRRRHAGVITDGADWHCYHLDHDGLRRVSSLRVRPRDPAVDELVVWLEGILATATRIPPTPREIVRRLGAGSPSHALDQARLRSLYALHGHAEDVRVKRRFWAQLLGTALGSQFVASDELFVEHTLLVITAAVIAHAVLGLEVEDIPLDALLSGAKFREHGIRGLVEVGFFDWMAGQSGGQDFLHDLVRRLARFDWRNVDHDVLKVLYESVITPETRKALGEYYTPNWLAQAVVAEAVTDPLEQRVLDPSCGSGTFLFHAVRRYLEAAEAAGHSTARALAGVTSRVLGMDLHPVAAVLASVTYVLALGTERLNDPDRPALQVPVYLGDSVQWRQLPWFLLSGGDLVIRVEEGAGSLFEESLRFPAPLLRDAGRFDDLVEDMTRLAAVRSRGTVPPLGAIYRRLGIPEVHRPVLDATFRTLCELQDQGRNHVWGFFIRNLVRPLWMAQPRNRVDVLVGNPPWLAFRHMPEDLQQQFRDLSRERNLWAGASVATQQDLSSLFVARVVELYLAPAGRLAFVMPSSTLDRPHYHGFREGDFSTGDALVRIAFSTPWDLRRVRPHPFPRACAVVFGTRTNGAARPMPDTAQAWEGTVEGGDPPWSEVAPGLERHPVDLHRLDDAPRSPYADRFRNGASVFPRVLFLVEKLPSGPLGRERGTARVRSVRSRYEKAPWKELESREGVVESQFVVPLLLGEHVLPYRVAPPARAVLPVVLGRQPKLLSGDHPDLPEYRKLAEWWRHQEAAWEAHRSSDRLSLVERLDYHGGLGAQLAGAPTRIVYAKSGMHLAAARLPEDAGPSAVVDHTLYWASAASDAEAWYLCAVLNAATTTRRVRPLMSYGKDERHVDKHVWRLPIPEFDPQDPLHRRLAELGRQVEREVASLELDEGTYFVTLRRRVRSYLEDSEAAGEIEEGVGGLLG